MTPAETALSLLRASRDAERDAPIWHDNGRTVARLAETAGVRVVYVHVDLTALATEFRTVAQPARPRLRRNAPQSPKNGGR